MKLNLPNDADGNVIPSNVKVMYEKDGSVVRVDDFVHSIVSKKWCVRSGNVMFNPSKLYLNKPDSLKQLNEDLSRVADFKVDGVFSSCACAYVGSTKDLNCACCKFGDSDDQCYILALKDIATRMNRLCGDSE